MSGRPKLFALMGVAAAIGGCGSGGEDHERLGRAQVLAEQGDTAGYAMYWAGASVDGLALTDVTRRPERTTLVYGTCDPSGSETGCAPPVTIQVSSICDHNALVLDIRPARKLRLRGTVVLDYGEASREELAAGASHVTVSADAARTRRAIAALRAVSGPSRVGAALPAPRYPRAYVEELRRVAGSYRRLGDVRAVRTQLGISKKAVRFRLGLAGDLSRARLARRSGWTRAGACPVEPARAARRDRRANRGRTRAGARVRPRSPRGRSPARSARRSPRGSPR
jgi:hypothetical protein